jgi:hypothetical protein
MNQAFGGERGRISIERQCVLALVCWVIGGGLPAAAAPEPLHDHGLRWQSANLFGGSEDEVVWDIAVGPDDSVYLVGQTNSSDFPTAHPLQAQYRGHGDAFVMRIAPDRQSLIYSTFLGGIGTDVAVGLAVGPTGEAYVVGLTDSSDFPRGITAHEQRGAASDLFAVRIAPDGSRLDWTTVLGGQGAEGAEGVVFADDGFLYIAANTPSPDFPVREAFQDTLQGASDGLILRLDPGSGAPLVASYLGGTGVDDIRAVAAASDGSVYFAGNTDSTDLPKRSGAQPSFAGGRLDVFVARVLDQGKTLAVTTYLGGSADDNIGPGALTIDRNGNLLLAAASSSADFPMVGALQPRFSDGGFDAIVAVIDPERLVLKFSTYLGGTDSDFAARSVSDGRRIYVTGSTASQDFPVRCAPQPRHGRLRYDGFIAVLEIDPPRLAYSTHVGSDSGHGLAWTSTGELVVSGDGLGVDVSILDPWPFPAGGGGDGFLMTLAPSASACPGDCCADGHVSVDDLVTGVGIALGTHLLGDCSSLDTNRDGRVSVSELITAVRSGLGECEGAADEDGSPPLSQPMNTEPHRPAMK